MAVGWEDVEFLGSAVREEHYPRHDLPEIALVGRSNVGKSSLINALVNRRNLARPSGQPGRTQTLNFYRIGRDLCLVDLPGYGYAQVPERIRQAWRPMIEGYLQRRLNLAGVVQVVDSRHPPSPDDCTMAQYLRDRGKPAVAVATKLDKLARGRWAGRAEAVARQLGLPVVLFSARTGHGRQEVAAAIRHMVAVHGN